MVADGETFGKVWIAEFWEKLRTNLNSGVSALHFCLEIPRISGHAGPYMTFTVLGPLGVLRGAERLDSCNR